MPRGLKVSCPLIATMILFVNIRNFYKLNFLYNMVFSVAHWDASKNFFCFSVQGDGIIEHTNGKCHVCHFSQLVDHYIT